MMEPKTFVQVRRQQEWQERSARCSVPAQLLLCSSASAFLQTKAGKRQRGVGTQEVTAAGSSLGTALCGAREVLPGGKVPPGFSS